MTLLIRSAVCTTLFLGSAQPALADHAMAGAGSASSGPILTGSTETSRAGSFSTGIDLRIVDPDATSDARLIALAGQHVHAHTTDGMVVATLSATYGLTGHIDLSASLPWVSRMHLREGHHSHSGGVTSNTVDQLGTVSGIGDLTLSTKYQFLHSHPERWGVALITGLKLPTGSTHKSATNGEWLETEHQPGTGSWDPIVGLSAYKGSGTWAVYGETRYQFATRGAQATRMGDHALASLALVREFGGEKDHGDQHHHAAPWSMTVEGSYEYEGRQNIAGVTDGNSGSKVIWLSPGLRYTSPQAWGAALSVGVPLWQGVGISHPDNAWRAVFQVGTKL